MEIFVVADDEIVTYALRVTRAVGDKVGFELCDEDGLGDIEPDEQKDGFALAESIALTDVDELSEFDVRADNETRGDDEIEADFFEDAVRSAREVEAVTDSEAQREAAGD